MTPMSKVLLNFLVSHQYFIKKGKTEAAKFVESQILAFYNSKCGEISSQVYWLETEGYILRDGKITKKGRQVIAPVEQVIQQESFLDTLYELPSNTLIKLMSDVLTISADRIREEGVEIISQDCVDALNTMNEVYNRCITPFVFDDSVVEDEDIFHEEVVTQLQMA